MNIRTIAVFALSLLTATDSHAQIRITEWEYNGTGTSTAGEFFELMNIGNAPINMAGWSFDDSQPRGRKLLALGVWRRAAEGDRRFHRSNGGRFPRKWNLLPASVKVIGGNTQNLSRADEINIYDNTNALVDRLTYDDQTPVGMPSIRTNGVSGNPITLAALGANDKFQWKLSVAGDSYGSYTSTEGNLGNPGVFTLIPEPASLLMVLIGVCGLTPRRTR